jgi:uncharacterized membrane protein
MLLVGSVPIVAPLFASRWFDSHEAASYLARVVEVRECWNDGMWSARWFPDLAGGRGYPFLSFYAPATFWVAGAVSLLGSVMSAWKVVVIVATCAGLTGTYRLAREGMSPLAAMVAAWFYAYAPYHLRDLWTRGDLAEYAAMGLLPWALFVVLRLRRTADPISTVGAGLVVA